MLKRMFITSALPLRAENAEESARGEVVHEIGTFLTLPGPGFAAEAAESPEKQGYRVT
jgi:hypothetical protein